MKKRIVVTVLCGLVTSVYTDTDDIDVIVLDGDIEGADQDVLYRIADNDGYANEWMLIEGPIDVNAPFVDRVFKLARKEDHFID